MKFTPRLPDTNVNVSPGNLLKDFAFMLGGLALLFVVAFFALGVAVDFVAPRLSWEMEQTIAGYLLDDQDVPAFASPAPLRIAELTETIRTRTTNIPHPVRVFIMPSKSINAFALPGGRLLINQGLLDALEYENELVFILGHELGHIEAKDHLRMLGRGLTAMALTASMFGQSSAVGETLGSLITLTDRKFSRDQEYRADRKGVDAMQAIYGHVGGVHDTFGHLGGKDYAYLAEFSLTHPETSKRIQALERYCNHQGYTEKSLKLLGKSPTTPQQINTI